MKKLCLVLIAAVTCFNVSNAQVDNTFTDSRDSNVYKFVTIGTQTWMAENLKYLPSVAALDESSMISPRYYVYDYNGTDVAEAKATDNYTTYGVLYNWNAAMTGSKSSTANPSGIQGVCPIGWHLPSDSERVQLDSFLFPWTAVKLKETGFEHWTDPNTGYIPATNETGFTGLPGGFIRFGNNNAGEFLAMGTYASFWVATQDDDTNYAWTFILSNFNEWIELYSRVKPQGHSVRCICDSVVNQSQINEINYAPNIEIYPNPAIDKVCINYTETENANLPSGQAKMQVYDMAGKCVLESGLTSGTNDIDVIKLPKGIYMIHIIGSNWTMQYKLAKE